MARKKRFTVKGERHGNAKLTDRKVREIRWLRSEGFGLVQIAKDFNVSHSLISLICQGKRWGHVS